MIIKNDYRDQYICYALMGVAICLVAGAICYYVSLYNRGRKKAAWLEREPHQRGVVVAIDNRWHNVVFVDVNGDGVGDKELRQQNNPPFTTKQGNLWLDVARVGDVIEFKSFDYAPRTIKVIDKHVRINGYNIEQLKSLQEDRRFQECLEYYSHGKTR